MSLSIRPVVATTTSSFCPPDAEPHRRLLDAGCEIRINPYDRKLTEDESVEVLAGTHGVVAGTSPITSRVLDAAPTLAVVSRVGVGLDSVDVAAVHDRGVELYITAEAVRAPVAELTIGLILSVLRQIPAADRMIRAGDWRQVKGRLLSERTVAVVGFGGIGRSVAQLLAPFGCRVLACDVAGIDSGTAAEFGVEERSLADALTEADVVTVHVPLTDETRGIIGEAEFGTMPEGSIVVNTARGGVVDEAALCGALDSGHLAGAGLDVFDREPYSGPLTDFDNVVLTTHLGSATIEARDRMENEAVERILTVFRHRGLL